MKNLFLLIILISLFSCNSKHKENNTTSIFELYDFEIFYTYQGLENKINDKYRKRLSSDTLYLIFQSNFSNDFLTIDANNKNVFSGKILTEPSSGIAGDLKIGQIEKIKYLSISINNSPTVQFELINKSHNIIGIEKNENKVSILFYKEVPVFH